MKQMIIIAVAAMFGLALFAGSTCNAANGVPPTVGQQEKATYMGKRSVAGLHPPCKGATTRPCAIESFTVVSVEDDGAYSLVRCEVAREYPDGLVIQCEDREFSVPHGTELIQVIIDDLSVECQVAPAPPGLGIGGHD